MNFLICLAITFLAAARGQKWILKHASGLYGAAALAAVFVIGGTALGIPSVLPRPVEMLLWDPIARGSLAAALFAAVMYAGALPNGSALRRQLLALRTDFSIIAGFLSLGHNFSLGQEHFVSLFLAPASMAPNLRLAAICSLVMLAIFLPLWITSFPAVRRKMAPKAWKKLQRLAYGFYGLTYLHVLLIFLPMAKDGQGQALFNLLIYTLVFLGYAGLRLRKVLGGKNWPLAASALLGAVILAAALPGANQSPAPQPVPAETAPSETAPAGETTAPEGQPAGRFQDGEYVGSGKGYRDKIRVRVLVSGGRIAEITVLNHDEDDTYWKRTLPILDTVLEQQTWEVDTATSATKSSKGLLNAIKNALKGAES